MKETMENVPYLKELVDYYSGPDRVTAKKQQEELERVAKTLPETAPNSVKRFTDRAILSLQVFTFPHYFLFFMHNVYSGVCLKNGKTDIPSQTCLTMFVQKTVVGPVCIHTLCAIHFETISSQMDYV